MKSDNTIEKNAMIIEDEKDLSFLLSSVLKRNNLNSDCAFSLNEARHKLFTANPSFIFIDNHLPDGLGSDFIRHIKLNKPDAKIVMITAHDSYNDIDKAFKNGADYFISKPFNMGTLTSMIDILKNKLTA